MKVWKIVSIVGTYLLANSIASMASESRDWAVLPEFGQLRSEIGWSDDYSERCEDDLLKKEADVLLNAGKFREAIITTDKWLNSCPIDTQGHYMAMIAYSELGEIENGRPHFDWYEGLIKSILDSGDGQSSETAYLTISVREEICCSPLLGA